MSLDPLHLCLLFSSALFCLGLIGALARSSTILVLLALRSRHLARDRCDVCDFLDCRRRR